MDRNRFTWSLSLYYTTLFLILGLQLPYLPLWLESEGLSATQISVILAIPMAVRIGATPAMTFIADRLPGPGVAILLYSAATAVLFLGYHLADGFWAIAVVTVFVSIFLNPLMPITEATAMRGARLYAVDYGRIRLWGSLSFIAANIVGGAIVARAGGPGALIALNGAAVLTALAALTLPRRGNRLDGDAEPSGTARASFPELLGLLRHPGFAGVLIGSGLIQASHAFYYAFGSISWVAEGISPSTIGLLWAVGVLVEVGLFAVSGRVLALIGVRGLFAVGVAAAIVRWTLMVWVWPAAAYFPIQALHALTFGATHLATMNYLSQSAPDRHGNGAQGLYFTVYGAMTGLVMLAAGPLYRSYGAGGYAAMAVMAALGGIVLLVSLRRR
jgi:MFS transporter, PPP family, 3-phenylpropionic acid transporter